MKLIEYLKDRIVFLTISAILFFITYITLIVTNTSKQIIFLAFILWFGPLVTYMILDFIRQKNYYEKVIGICDHLDKKYLLSEVIDKPKYLNEKIVYDLLRESNRSMRDNINYYKNMQNDYKEYIETWVHEIKTPISSTMLFIENNSDIIPQHIKSEIQKIEDYVEQVLYYSRSSDVNKDYIIKKFNIEDIVRKVIRKNARDCINKKIAINVENIDNIIYSDPKWVEFIINQIMINSIKYSKNKNAIIDISSVSNDNNIVLTIKDNGVGIDEKDVFRVFEKGFTGENGRKYSKSTGIGLYLCKKLCNKLGLNINLTSNKDMGTTVNIVFPINSDTFR